MELAEKNGSESGKYKLPDSDLLLKIVMGDVDLEKEEEVELALWAMDELYPTIFGIANFGPRVRFYTVMQKVRIAHNDSFPLFTPSNMAWMVLLIDNSRTKWEAIAELQKGNRKTTVPKKPTKKQMESNAANADDMIYHAAKYTDPAQGQVKYSSWSSKGMKQFKNWQDKIAQHWKDHSSEVSKVNKALLEKIRERKQQAGILTDISDNATNHKNKKRKLSGGSVVKKEEIVNTGNFGIHSRNMDYFRDDDQKHDSDDASRGSL